MNYDKFIEILIKEVGFDFEWRKKGKILKWISSADKNKLIQRIMSTYKYLKIDELELVIEKLLLIEDKSMGFSDIETLLSIMRFDTKELTI